MPVPGRPAGPAAPGYGGPGHGSYGRGPQGDPWVPGGVPGYGGPQPTVPPGPPPSYGAAGRYGVSRLEIVVWAFKHGYASNSPITIPATGAPSGSTPGSAAP